MSSEPVVLINAFEVPPDADFRFVNVALWESAEAFRAAISQPEFRATAGPFASHPSLYEVVRAD
jgi:hypothetical protein